MKTLWKMSLILLAVCAIAAGSLAFVYKATKPMIEKQSGTEKIEALKEVMPEATRFEEIMPGKKWTAYKENTKVGLAVEVTAKGYGGPIRIIFGVDGNKKITKMRILEHNETPGLGAKIKENSFLNQFEGKTGNEIVFKKDDPANGKIDAITSATISSRAVTNTVKKGLLEE